MEVTGNSIVEVKLTDEGIKILRERHQRLYAALGKPETPFDPSIDADGWRSFMLWDLMRTFGPHITMGRVPPFGTTIRIKDKS